MAPVEKDFLMDILLPLMVMLLMLGMGSTVDKVQAKGALGRWKAIGVGMFSQFVFMPFCAWLLGAIFGLTPTERIGLIIVGCTPGGTTSQLFTYWSKGSVALSIIMTTASTTAALFMMIVLFAILVNPFEGEVMANSADICVGLINGTEYGGGNMTTAQMHAGVTAPADFLDKGVTQMPKYCWDSVVSPDEWACAEKFQNCNGDLECMRTTVCERVIKPDMKGIITMLALVVLPAAIGYSAREPCYGASKQSRWHDLRLKCQTCVARWMGCVGSAAGGIVVIVLIIYGAIVYDYVWDAKAEIWLCCILIGVLGFVFGYFVSRACGFGIREARTISLETGIQNGPLAILIVKAAFPECSETQPYATCVQKQALLFPYLYSIWVVINSVIIVFGVYTRQRPEPIPDVPAIKSRPLTADAGAARASLFQEDGQPTSSFSLPESHSTYDASGKLPTTEIKTLHDSFQRGVRLHGDRPCLGTRQSTGLYTWHTYSEVYGLAQDLGSGLRRKCGMVAGDFLAIMAPNRAEWIVTAEAAHAYNFVKVPLYDTLGDEAVKHIVNQTGLKVVICSQDQQENLKKLVASGECPSLKHIVVMSEEPLRNKAAAGANADSQKKIVNIGDLGNALDSSATPAAGAGAIVSTFLSVVAEGSKSRVEPTPATDPNDNCMLCYTSGTTGLPKGAEISHGNMIATMGGLVAVDKAVQGRGEKSYFFEANDVHISYLPLAHIFEQLNFAALMCVGGRAGFFSGSIPLLMDDIAELKPTIFCSVPRLLNKLHDKVMARVEAQKGWCGAWPPPELAKKLFKNGFAKKKEELPLPSVEHGFWDATVFSNVAQRLGGRVRLIITGSAPISAEVLDFLRIAFSCNVVEGYGQTESTAALTLSYPHDTSTGHAGVPLPCCDVKLVDVPEMDYLSTDKPCPRGEICCRGANVFKGYYKEPEKTAEAIDKDGWLHTGDIGQWNADGTLKIIDRKKNIFKLSQGEYVAPEKLESVAQSSQYIAQAFIYGDSLKHQLVSVIVPDFEVLKGWARDQSLTVGSGPGVDADGKVAPWYAELCALPAVKKLIMDELASTAAAAKLKGFEKAKEATIEAQPFDAERGLLTPTFKPKRPQLRTHYQDKIDAMYAALGI